MEPPAREFRLLLAATCDIAACATGGSNAIGQRAGDRETDKTLRKLPYGALILQQRPALPHLPRPLSSLLGLTFCERAGAAIELGAGLTASARLRIAL